MFALQVLERLKAHHILQFLTLDRICTFVRLASNLKREILQPQSISESNPAIAILPEHVQILGSALGIEMNTRGRRQEVTATVISHRKLPRNRPVTSNFNALSLLNPSVSCQRSANIRKVEMTNFDQRNYTWLFKADEDNSNDRPRRSTRRNKAHSCGTYIHNKYIQG
ncbi:hypothetical protein BYT27DRAFT_7093472 [Phlegmacium glaucopus]|nr:hypothetical protein BYT27DRAFT_7093472 [Phlegmacium glaucopus]